MGNVMFLKEVARYETWVEKCVSYRMSDGDTKEMTRMCGSSLEEWSRRRCAAVVDRKIRRFAPRRTGGLAEKVGVLDRIACGITAAVGIRGSCCDQKGCRSGPRGPSE